MQYQGEVATVAEVSVLVEVVKELEEVVMVGAEVRLLVEAVKALEEVGTVEAEVKLPAVAVNLLVVEVRLLAVVASLQKVHI